MATNVDYVLSWVVQFMLILTRAGVLFVFTPLLARREIPAMAKIGLSLLLTFIIINFHPPPLVSPFNTAFSLAAAILAELSVGLVIGVITLFFFNAIHTAGYIIDFKVGFAMAQIFDTSIGAQTAVTSGLLNFVLVLIFITTGGINQLIVTLVHTYEIIPIGAGVFRPELAFLAIEVFVRTFIIAVQIAMPLIASALVLEVALGIIVRTAPQMNVFVVGIPLKVLLGLFILIFTLPVFTHFTSNLFDEMFVYINQALGGMRP